ncbi:MAG: hypothetical protein FJ403_13095 [Verrucomicrobia bacterium]|nr:hypothetical protein [Verrucomicrobiota bacterium]
MADLTEEFAQELQNQCWIPAGICWTDEWRIALQRLNGIRVYTVNDWTEQIHVVVTSALPLRLEREAEPSLEMRPKEILTAVAAIRGVYERWCLQSKVNVARFTFFTVGSMFSQAELEAATTWWCETYLSRCRDRAITPC